MGVKAVSDVKRSLLIVLIGIVFTLLFTLLGTEAVLNHDRAWRTLVAGAPNSGETFSASLMQLRKIIPRVVVLVYVPAGLLAGLLIGLFASRRRTICAIVASSPAWVPLLFITILTALEGIVIAGIAVLSAWFSGWITLRIHRLRRGNVTT
jgi:hypothetical protein